MLSLTSFANAHPVPKENHDRTVRVRLVAGDTPGEMTVRVDYRLEVDELTVVLDDMKPYARTIDYTAFKGNPLGYYGEYAKIYAPILASKLRGKVDGRPLEFKAMSGTPTLKEDDGKDLGHLRVDFVFEAVATYPPKGPFDFEFREGTYLLQKGEIKLSLDQAGPWFFESVVAPDEKFWTLAPIERPIDSDDTARDVRAKAHSFPGRDQPPVAPTPAVAPPPDADDDHSLLRLIQSDAGFWLMMFLAFWFGAAHALTPGHGKTLVAAYLVGERGTVFHAIALGVISTASHTWSVLTLAAVIHWFGLSPAARAWIQSSLPFVLGLSIVCFGFLLLLQRLAGRADHVHLGGGHHHHHGHDHQHNHDLPTNVTWGGLLLLGITGSIIPCWDAIGMLAYAIGKDELTWAVPLVLSFSAGLATVLIAIGILVVKARGFADRHFGESRLVRWLPIVSAIAIILLGFWLCRQSVRESAWSLAPPASFVAES